MQGAQDVLVKQAFAIEHPGVHFLNGKRSQELEYTVQWIDSMGRQRTTILFETPTSGFIFAEIEPAKEK